MINFDEWVSADETDTYVLRATAQWTSTRNEESDDHE